MGLVCYKADPPQAMSYCCREMQAWWDDGPQYDSLALRPQHGQPTPIQLSAYLRPA